MQVSTDFDACVAHARDGLVIIATPMAALEPMLRALPGDAPGVLWLCKGFEAGSGALGIEAGANINAENEGGRAGLFARYDWRGGEISISAGASNGGPLGLSGDMIEGASPYATINWLTHF